MITCDLTGRLGNNLFQIAAAIGHAKKMDTEAVLFQHWKHNQQLFTPFKVVDAAFRTFAIEFDFGYSDLPFDDSLKIFGYRQSEKYFQNAADEVREKFRWSNAVKSAAIEAYDLSGISGTKIAIGVRRGDYVSMTQCHPLLQMDYYVEAAYTLGKDAGATYIVFSDDLPWCRTHFSVDYGWPFVGQTLFCTTTGAAESMYLMSLCDEFIIANSTFSWWGAWLSESPDKHVVAPMNKYPWFGPSYKHLSTSDIIPKEWVVL